MEMTDLRVAFVGSLIPESDCPANPICNMAGNKFQKNFVSSLRRASGGEIDVITYVPAIMFPRGRRVIYGRETLTLEERIQDATTVRYINLPVMKQLTQASSIFFELLRWHWRNRKSRRVVIVYNVFAPHALPVLAARAVAGGTAVALVADLPHGLYDFVGIWGLMQRLDMKAQIASIARFDGQIALTQMIVDDFAPRVPAVLLEGGVDHTEAVKEARAVLGQPHVVLFSGTLNEVNGTRLMLDAFARISESDYRLRIFGRGPGEDLAIDAAAGDSRIEYLGFQPNSAILQQQRNAAVLLNPRPTSHAITRYTFPSKLLEYMLSGRPVITTRLAGIPMDYYPYLYLLDEETPEALAALIRRVCSASEEALTEFGARARDFVLRNKTWTRQGERVFQFVHDLAEAGA